MSVSFAHLSSISVELDQEVTIGEPIGLSGSTGTEEGSCLHMEFQVGEEKVSYGAKADKAEKAENHRERISVKDKINEKKDIISKKAAEKSAPSKDHQMGL